LTVFICHADINGNPTQIVFQSLNLYPAGIENSDDLNKFWLSSATQGTLYTVDDNGVVEIAIQNPHFQTTVGVRYDPENRRLCTVSTPGFGPSVPGNNGGIFCYDFDGTTYTLAFETQLATNGSLLNDLTFDETGDVYFTDSFKPNIYKVTNTGILSIPFSDQRFTPIGGGVGLDGIVYHPDHFLIVNIFATSELFKVDIASGLITPITFTDPNPVNQASGFDGMRLDPADSNHIFVTGSLGIFSFFTQDNWLTAIVGIQPPSDSFDGGADLCIRGGRPFVIRTFFGDLVNGLNRTQFIVAADSHAITSSLISLWFVVVLAFLSL